MFEAIIKKKSQMPFDTKKYTFDSNGNVIPFMKKKPSLITDFTILNTLIRDRNRSPNKKAVVIRTSKNSLERPKKILISSKVLPEIIYNK